MKQQLIFLCIAIIFGVIHITAQQQETTEAPRPLTVMLYPYIPDSGNDNFQALTQRLEREFEALHPDIDLTIIMDMQYNTYDTDMLATLYAPSGPNAIELDLMMLGYVHNQGWINSVEITGVNYFPVAEDAALIANTPFAIPTRVCSLYLFSHASMFSQVTNTNEYLNTVHLVDPNDEHRDLLGEFYGKDSLPIYYTAFYMGTYGAAYAQQSFEMPPDMAVIDAMASMFSECTYDDENQCLGEYYAGELYGAAIDFANGEALTYIGFSESLNYIQNITSDSIYVSPAPFGNNVAPLVYTDGITVNKSNCQGQCEQDVATFAAYYASSETQLWINLAHDIPGSVPRYLLAANLDFYRQPEIMNDYPIFYQFALPIAYGRAFPDEGFPAARSDMFTEICAALDDVMGNELCPPPTDLPLKGS